MSRRFAVIGAVLLGLAATGSSAAGLVVGSKKFTESVILGELARQSVAAAGTQARHRRELGGTRILWNALLRGDIDVYPEYTGTLRRELLGSNEQLEQALAEVGIGMTGALGFSNNYALGMLEDAAAASGVRRISDLHAHPELRFGFSNEFMQRADGWPGLREAYALPQTATGLDHDLAYRGLASGSLDVIDLYSTDAEIAHYGIRLLEDDRAFFTDYAAVYLYRLDLAERAPAALAALRSLAGALDDARMSELNLMVKVRGSSESAAAASQLAAGSDAAAGPGESWLTALLVNTRAHLLLVLVSLSAAIAVALPLGVLAAHHPRFGAVALGVAGILQTIPALALLVVMIPLFGIGALSAVVALLLYSILPVLRNTHAGLTDIAPGLRESAYALGLDARTRLFVIELPLAAPTILAGIKTAAVINVGTATLGALIGAGGYGQPILTGIRLDDTALILQGAVPAALLALLVQLLFDVLEKRVRADRHGR